MHYHPETVKKFATEYEAEQYAYRLGRPHYVAMRGANSSPKPWHVVKDVLVDS